MKTLVADKVSSKMVSDLKALGCEVVLNPELTAEALPAALAGVEILIVRSTKVSAEAIAAGTSLSLIIRAGAAIYHFPLVTENLFARRFAMRACCC